MQTEMKYATAQAAHQSNHYKEIVVSPRSARRETLWLMLAIAAIVLMMSTRFVISSSKEEPKFLRSYQRLDSILATSGQRNIYQSLLSSVREVELIRDEEGLWPEVELLQMEQIPPYDKQFLPRRLQSFSWTSHDGGSWIDYLGQSRNNEDPITFLLRLIDIHAEYHPHPHPGIDYDPAMNVVAQVWIYPEANRPYPGERLPEADWLWVVRPNDWTLNAPEDKQILEEVQKKREEK